ncbi:hypothetical protein ACWEJ6_48845 [Nonomuraea sp. NPDC004702]
MRKGVNATNRWIIVEFAASSLRPGRWRALHRTFRTGSDVGAVVRVEVGNQHRLHAGEGEPALPGELEQQAERGPSTITHDLPVPMSRPPTPRVSMP